MTVTKQREAQRIVVSGKPIEQAAGAVFLLHGRGGSAEDMLALGSELTENRLALLALEAPGHTWYPYSFLAPREQNEPYLSSALKQVEEALAFAGSAGLDSSKIAFCGFSQGACLATEFVARHPRRYAGLLVYTGGLIGPLDEPIALTGDLAGTPVLLSSGDPDPHVPWKRVQQSGELLTGIGAKVTLERYPGRPHTVLTREVEQGRQLLQPLLDGASLRP